MGLKRAHDWVIEHCQTTRTREFPLTTTPPNYSSPEDIVQLKLKGVLVYVAT
jgi:hypothetical protein